IAPNSPMRVSCFDPCRSHFLRRESSTLAQLSAMPPEASQGTFAPVRFRRFAPPNSTTAEVLVPGRFRYFQIWIHARVWIDATADLRVDPTLASRLFGARPYRVSAADVTDIGRALGFVHIWIRGKRRPMSI